VVSVTSLGTDVRVELAPAENATPPRWEEP
jgi:hypothetical protein